MRCDQISLRSAPLLLFAQEVCKDLKKLNFFFTVYMCKYFGLKNVNIFVIQFYYKLWEYPFKFFAQKTDNLAGSSKTYMSKKKKRVVLMEF